MSKRSAGRFRSLQSLRNSAKLGNKIPWRWSLATHLRIADLRASSARKRNKEQGTYPAMAEAMTEWFMGTGKPKPETYEAVHHHSKYENNSIEKGVRGQRLPDRIYMMGGLCSLPLSPRHVRAGAREGFWSNNALAHATAHFLFLSHRP